MAHAKHKSKALQEKESQALQEQGETIVTLYTLAPETLDKPGTVSVGGYWLYSDDNVPEQVLREVLVDKESSVAQMQAYRLKIPYITFSEEGMNKALAKGLVYRADNQLTTAGYEEITPPKEEQDNPWIGQGLLDAAKERDAASIVAGIDATITTLENALQDTEEKLIMARNKAPKTPAAPKAPEHISILKDETTAPAPACPALDAILAAPIVDAIKTPFSVTVPAPKKHLALPEERTEEAIVAGMELGTMPHEIYRAFVKAFRQALKEENLVIVPAHTLVSMEPGCGEDEPKAPVPHDPIGDAWGSMMDEPKAPAQPKSTLVLGPNVPKAPKAPKTPAHDIPGNNGKVPVDTIIAIQTAWKNKTATQAELAKKYNLDDKKVWYFVNRAKQLV